MEIKLILEGTPITKKNSQRIIRIHGRPCIVPSKQYKAYESACLRQIHDWMISQGAELNGKPDRDCYRLDIPVNVQCIYHMPTKRRVDLTNLLEATDDILVAAGILRDDHCGIVAGHDGSRVICGDKQWQGVDVTITEVTP